MTNKEKREYLSLTLAYNTVPFTNELGKINNFHLKRPKKLFKFRAFDKFTYDMLNNKYVYLSPAESLDDPFDCLTNIDLDRIFEKDHTTLSKYAIEYMVDAILKHLNSASIDKNELIRIIYFSSKNGDVDCKILNDELQKISFLNDREKALFSSVLSNLNNVISSLIEGNDLKNLFKLLIDSKRSIGVCSLTTKRDNKVMWSIYSNTYKGYCVEYEQITDTNILNCLKPVIYTKKLNKDLMLAVFEFIIEAIIRYLTSGIIPTSIGALYELLCTKDSDWSYQYEWRIISNAKDRKTMTAKAVYLGFDVSKEDEIKMKECAIKNGFLLLKMNKPNGTRKITYTKLI